MIETKLQPIETDEETVDTKANSNKYEWNQISDSNIPEGVIDISYDEERDMIYFYCGDVTWEYDYNNETWNRLEDGSGNPISYPTNGTNALKSSFNNNLLSLGTYDTTTPVQETWQLDPSTPAWNKLSLSTQPPARLDHEFEGNILFGGRDGNGNYFNDTWQWEEQAKDWTEITTATSPPARANFAMTEAEDGNIYIYGGENSNGLLNDFWMFNGSDWNELISNSSISNRTNPILTKTLSVFGGYNGTDYLSDIYEYDSDTNQFVEDTGFSGLPSARADSKTVYTGGTFYLYGGEDSSGELSDMYTLSEITYNLFSYEIDPNIYTGIKNVSVS